MKSLATFVLLLRSQETLQSGLKVIVEVLFVSLGFRNLMLPVVIVLYALLLPKVTGHPCTSQFSACRRS
jgi:hypothetical protein